MYISNRLMREFIEPAGLYCERAVSCYPCNLHSHVCSIQVRSVYSSQLTAMAAPSPRPFDHFSAVVKQLEVRQKVAAELAVKSAAQAEAANKLVMEEAAEVLRKE